jgi:hypothetical protein
MTETELIAEELDDFDDLPFTDWDPFDDYGVCEEEDGF